MSLKCTMGRLLRLDLKASASLSVSRRAILAFVATKAAHYLRYCIHGSPCTACVRHAGVRFNHAITPSQQTRPAQPRHHQLSSLNLRGCLLAALPQGCPPPACPCTSKPKPLLCLALLGTSSRGHGAAPLLHQRRVFHGACV